MSNTAPADSGTVLAGKLPDRNDYYGTKYSCNFGFQQKYTGSSSFPDIDTPFYKGGEPTENDPYYLVAGSNQIEPIKANVPTDSFSGTVPDNFDFEEKAAATNNFEESGENPENIFQHFPKGGLGVDIDPRNPTTVCQIRGLCPDS